MKKINLLFSLFTVFGVVRAAVLDESLVRGYAERFNAGDEELYTNAIPNVVAADFLVANAPRFECPDKEIELTYYFRWWTFRKHLRRTPSGWVITEFLPDVGWAGKHNTISCPMGHHQAEGRWLRDGRMVAEYTRFMLTEGKTREKGAYICWPATGILRWCDVTGDEKTVAAFLPDLVRNYQAWEKGWVVKRWPRTGEFRIGLCENGLFSMTDNYEGSEFSLGEDGYRPFLNCAMESEARSIAEIARRIGDQALFAHFDAKAKALSEAIRRLLWNPDVEFFTVRSTENAQKTVRELHGYVPWYFGMKLGRSYDVVWKHLMSERGFLAPWGLTVPERAAPGFGISYKGHCCLWNGPVWPYATSLALTALANRLQACEKRPEGLADSTFSFLLHQYAAAHVLVKPDGTRVPWIDENQNPFTGDWIARTRLLGQKGVRERGKDYNHSTFCDLVIGGLCGFLPRHDGTFAVKPLAPKEWDWWCLDNVRHCGHDMTILFDRDGTHYGRGRGLVVLRDGKPAEVVVRADARNVSSAVLAGIDRLRAAGGGTLRFEKGTYHFSSENAVKTPLYMSNHDKLPVHPVFLPLTNLVGVTVDGGGSRFVFHGKGIAALVMDSERVTLRNFSVDWSRPYNTEFTVRGYENGKTLVDLDETKYPVEIRNGRIHAVGEDWTMPTGYGSAFDGETGEMLERVADVRFDGLAEARGKGRYLLGRDLSRIGLHGAKAGDVFVSRPCAEPWRPHPAIAVYRAKDTVVEDVVLHAAFGMGILVQRSENFSMCGTGTGAAKTCGVWPAEGRMCAQMVDATHFVGVKGKVSVTGCRFERMLDDAINVHSTGLGIVSNPAPNIIVCRGMHDQGWGFDMFAPGERLRFIKAKTLENRADAVVTAVRALSPRETELMLSGPLPSDIGVGDAVENAEWQCAVDFTDNVVARNRARGVLFTTPKPVLVQGNLFENVSGAAILLAGDVRLWYETGACDGVRIVDNMFRNCLTSHFQYCEAVVSVYPTVEDLTAQSRPYHRNLLIEDNVFETFDAPLLFARSVDGICWRGNRIVSNNRYCGWGRRRFETEGSTRVMIEEKNGNEN